MRKSILALVPAAAAALAFGAGSAAQASTTPHIDNGGVVGTLQDTVGTAGYYTNSFAATYTQVDGTFKLNLPSYSDFFLSEDGAISIQLCNTSTGRTSELGVIPSTNPAFPNEWEVVAAHGTYDTSVVNTGDPCQGNSFFNQVGAGNYETALGYVPAGTTVQAEIKEVGHGLLLTVADSNLTNFQHYFAFYPGPAGFNEAGAGISTDTNILVGPPSTDMVDFSNVTAVSAGGQHGLAYWDAVAVESVNGYGQPIIAPTALNPSACTITYHPGHRYYYGSKGHRHYRWIKGYTTSSGCGASSFSVDIGNAPGI